MQAGLTVTGLDYLRWEVRGFTFGMALAEKRRRRRPLMPVAVFSDAMLTWRRMLGSGFLNPGYGPLPGPGSLAQPSRERWWPRQDNKESVPATKSGVV